MTLNSLINSYTSALIQLCDEKKSFENFIFDLKIILENNLDLVKMLSSYSLSIGEKHKIIDNIFSNNFDPLITNFLKLLVDKKHFGNIIYILVNFQKKINYKKNIISIDLYTPFDLEQKSLDKIIEFVKNKLNSEVVYKVIIDKTLLGGFKIVYDNYNVIDYSMKKKLDEIKSSIKEQEVIKYV